MLVVGLGNPEPRYAHNRHNLGFRVLDALAGVLKVDWARRFDGELGQAQVAGRRIYLLKPLTFMNRSGDSVGPAARFFKLSPAEVLVAHDELDLPLGRIQLKVGGGHNGHNGLKSVEAGLGTKEFGRLRLGIGRPPAEWDPADFVLADFQKQELDAVEAEVQQAVAALSAVLAQGMTKAMNEHNRRG